MVVTSIQGRSVVLADGSVIQWPASMRLPFVGQDVSPQDWIASSMPVTVFYGGGGGGWHGGQHGGGHRAHGHHGLGAVVTRVEPAGNPNTVPVAWNVMTDGGQSVLWPASWGPAPQVGTALHPMYLPKVAQRSGMAGSAPGCCEVMDDERCSRPVRTVYVPPIMPPQMPVQSVPTQTILIPNPGAVGQPVPSQQVPMQPMQPMQPVVQVSQAPPGTPQVYPTGVAQQQSIASTMLQPIGQVFPTGVAQQYPSFLTRGQPTFSPGGSISQNVPGGTGTADLTIRGTFLNPTLPRGM